MDDEQYEYVKKMPSQIEYILQVKKRIQEEYEIEKLEVMKVTLEYNVKRKILIDFLTEIGNDIKNYIEKNKIEKE